MSGDMKLFVVKKTDGRGQGYMMNETDTLDKVRAFLTSKELMNINDSFLLDGGIAVAREQEAIITLALFAKDDKVLIGLPTTRSPITPADDDVARYNQMNDDQKRAIFNNIQIFRGQVFGEQTFGKSKKDVYTWAPGYLPDANMPRVTTEFISDFSFSKVTSELKQYSSNSSSLSVSSPYGSAEAEYKTEKSTTTTTSKVTEYLITRYIVHKVNLTVNPQQLRPTDAFVAAVKAAIKNNEHTADGYANLIGVLDEYGYYIPVDFVLGGAIFATDTTTIDDFSVAVSEKEEFKASFKAEFEGIGGGGSSGSTSGSDNTKTRSHKYQKICLQQIGGKPGYEKDYPNWADSLKSAVNWNLADVQSFWPTLMLLAKTAEGRDALGTAINLIEKFSGYPTVQKLQRYLDMRAYNTRMQELLNPF